MSTSRTSTLVALVFCLLAVSSYIIMSQNMPNDIKLTREQAIAIVKASPKADPNKNTVKDEWLQSAELQYIAINWANYLRMSGSHNRIYVSTSPVGDINPYWIIEYDALQRRGTEGSYIVDALTGELMLALESTGAGFLGQDFVTSSTLAYDDYSPIMIMPGQSREVTIRFTALPSYDASLPMSVTVTAVPKGFTVSQNATSGILRTGGSFAIRLIILSIEGALGTYPPPWDSTPPHIEVELSLVGSVYGESIYVESGS